MTMIIFEWKVPSDHEKVNNKQMKPSCEGGKYFQTSLQKMP